jgi:uncharacterized protein (DUF433 family)
MLSQEGRIEIDPAVFSRKPVIHGTRILVTSILSQLAAGESFDTIRRGFPGLAEDDIKAAIEFAKDSFDQNLLGGNQRRNECSAVADATAEAVPSRE